MSVHAVKNHLYVGHLYLPHIILSVEPVKVIVTQEYKIMLYILL